MTKYKFISAAFLLVVIAALSSCKGGRNSDSESEEVLAEDIVEMRDDQIKLAKIETGKIELRSMSGTISVNGLVTTSPQDLATVCMPLGGFVKSTSMVPGSSVRKGQTLAVIQNPDFVDIQQNYLEVKSKLKYAEAEYMRQTELHKENVSSQKVVQQATSEYMSLKTQLKAYEQKLNLIGIDPAGLNDDKISSTVPLISPISGYIKTVNVNVGKYVNSSDVLFEIVNIENLLLELDLFEKDADKVSAGQKIHFYINNESERHEAVIYQTARSVGADKFLCVYADVTDQCKNIFPGMYVNALIESSGKEVTSLPSEAVVSFEDKDYIFVFVKNKEEGGKPFTEYRMLEVHKGISSDGYTEITLPEGFDYKKETVVVKGAYNLLSAKKNAGEMSCG